MLRNKLRYLAIMFLVALLAILYNEYFMGMIFLTIVFLPFVMFGLLCYIYGQVSAELLSNVHVVNRGEKIDVTVQIRNNTNFPISNLYIYLTYCNQFSGKKYHKELRVSADRKSITDVVCSITSQHAGNLEIRLEKIRVFDYLMVFSLRKKYRGAVKVAVLPKIEERLEDYELNQSKMIVESDYYSKIKPGDDPSEVFTIREYREGDRPQRIHWKLSMKEDQLMIKEFSDPLNCSILVFADLYFIKNDSILFDLDNLLESSLSLSYSFLLKGQIHYFCWYDASQKSCRRIRIENDKDLFEAVDGLLSSGAYQDKIDTLASYIAEHPNDQFTDLFYVTSRVSLSQINSLSMIRAENRQIMYIHDPLGVDDEVKKKERKYLLSEEMIKKTAEMGIHLVALNTGSMVGNME